MISLCLLGFGLCPNEKPECSPKSRTAGILVVFEDQNLRLTQIIGEKDSFRYASIRCFSCEMAFQSNAGWHGIMALLVKIGSVSRS